MEDRLAEPPEMVMTAVPEEGATAVPQAVPEAAMAEMVLLVNIAAVPVRALLLGPLVRATISCMPVAAVAQLTFQAVEVPEVLVAVELVLNKGLVLLLPEQPTLAAVAAGAAPVPSPNIGLAQTAAPAS